MWIPYRATTVSGEERIVTTTNHLSTGTKYLDNPLPLPPKPIRRLMDYPYEVSADKMFYDVEVADTDDYDIK